MNLPARGEYAECIAECGVAYTTCCQANLCADPRFGICFTNKKNCIKACSIANDEATTDAIADVDNDNVGAGLKPTLAEDAFVTTLSSLTIAFNEASHHGSQNRLDCMEKCMTEWDTCCMYGPNPYGCLSNDAWLSICSTKCNNCYKSCGSSGSCPTPGEKETTNEVTTDFDNNNDGVERSGRFIKPIVTEDA